VFLDAAAFNADISKWKTGQVTDMYGSTSTLLHPVCPLDGVTDLFFYLF
jgi:surface protein